jgi:D-aminoacyl-tRNA deacylase
MPARFGLLILIVLTVLASSSSIAMKLVVQRVKSASVTVDGAVTSSISGGLVALVGLHEHDTEEDLKYCSRRLLNCKLWANDNNKQWRHSVKQRELEVLSVSQFTLYGKLTKKDQPDYKAAMKNAAAQEMYATFLDMLKNGYEEQKIKDGRFGEMMDVALVNDGPVTIIIESGPKALETSTSVASTDESS